MLHQENTQQPTAPNSPCSDAPHQAAFSFLSCVFLGECGGEYKIHINQAGLIDTLTKIVGQYAALPCQHK